jgi:quercetin dioxygenase-like cupin family protein
MLSGKLQLKLEKAVYTVRAGDVIYLTSEMPSQWKNPGPSVARLLWLKIR